MKSCQGLTKVLSYAISTSTVITEQDEKARSRVVMNIMENYLPYLLEYSPGFYFLPSSGDMASKRDWPLFGTSINKILYHQLEVQENDRTNLTTGSFFVFRHPRSSETLKSRLTGSYNARALALASWTIGHIPSYVELPYAHSWHPAFIDLRAWYCPQFLNGTGVYSDTASIRANTVYCLSVWLSPSSYMYNTCR